MPLLQLLFLAELKTSDQVSMKEAAALQLWLKVILT
jgi:hypothetical protein